MTETANIGVNKNSASETMDKTVKYVRPLLLLKPHLLTSAAPIKPPKPMQNVRIKLPISRHPESG